MKRHLQQELQQSRPFPTLEEEVVVELQRTAQLLARRIALALRPWGLSESQFNVLRILRGSGPEGLASSRIGERMVRYDPDLTRLVDQLEKRGLVAKSRDTRDRRVVNSRITDEGLRVVEEASKELRQSLVALLAHLSAARLESLADLLERARESAAPEEVSGPAANRASARPASTSGRRRAAPAAAPRPSGRPGRRSRRARPATRAGRSRRSP